MIIELDPPHLQVGLEVVLSKREAMKIINPCRLSSRFGVFPKFTNGMEESTGGLM